MKSLSHVQLFATPWTVAYHALLSMEFSRQEYWSGCHFLLQVVFLTQGSNPGLLHYFMANRRGKVKAVTDFLFLGSKITVDGDFSHEIKRCLLLGRKAMTNLETLIKSRDITLLTKPKLWFFPVVMYGCES